MIGPNCVRIVSGKLTQMDHKEVAGNTLETLINDLFVRYLKYNMNLLKMSEFELKADE